jgi:hypothetical protein
MTLWKVDGIVAQKHKQRAKAVVLSDSPAGVEWGMGNLTGCMENGLLTWRNRTGKVMYEWERLGPENLDSQPAQPKNAVQEPTGHAVGRSNGKTTESAKAVKGKPSKESSIEPAAQFASPRSTSSTVSTAPTDAVASPTEPREVRATGTQPDKKQTNPSKEEVAKLLEMAGSRLASGDYGTAMQYVLFAQTLTAPDVK